MFMDLLKDLFRKRNYTHYLVFTKHHGGGIYKKCESEMEAKEAQAECYKKNSCWCGCVGIVKAEKYADLPYIDIDHKGRIGFGPDDLHSTTLVQNDYPGESLPIR